MALVVAVWAALASGDDEPSPSTTASTTTSAPPTSTTVTSTSTTSVPTTSTTAPSTSTTTNEEARVEEVRLILEDLYFRWFEAIYNNDEEAVRQVIATERGLANFQRAVDESDLPDPPDEGDINIQSLEILQDDSDCLVTYSHLDLTRWRGAGAQSEVVDVLWPSGHGWRFATSWQSKEDLWQDDCTADRTDELPSP